MTEKGEVGMLLKGFVDMARNQFEKFVKVIQSDNRLEFKSGPLNFFYLINNIIRQTSYVDTLTTKR